jgi:hypothetical protein
MRTLNLSILVFAFASQISFGTLQISKQPMPQCVWIGGQASFTVVAKGERKITYQWQKWFQDLPGETKSTLRIRKITESDRGAYSVLVSGGSSTVESASADLLIQGGYSQETEDFIDPNSKKGWVGYGFNGLEGLYPEISGGKLRFPYFSGITYQEDLAFWRWGRSPNRKQSFDVSIDGSDSTKGKLQFGVWCYPAKPSRHPVGFSYRIERDGRESNFNVGSWGDDGRSVKRTSKSTSSTQFSFRLVYDATSKVRTLKAYYDEDGPLNGKNWTLLQTVKNPNFTTGRPIIVDVVYNNGSSGEALDGNNVTVDNFQAR